MNRKDDCPTNAEIDLRATVINLGAVLTTLIALTVVIGWKFQGALDTSMGEMRKEIKQEYVQQSLYELQIKVLNEKIDAIMRAVGAKLRQEE